MISPLLANIYLHEVLDCWFEERIKPGLMGRGFLVRYADDGVLVFSDEADARWVKDELARQMSQYGLKLHPTKTRLVEFHPPRRDNDQGGTPRSFDFLGFTHYWGRHRKGWAVKRKTSSQRMSRTLKRLAAWLRRQRHRPVAWQHERLVKSLLGHDGYFGLMENRWALRRLRYEVTRLWRKWLSRRSRGPSMPWERYQHLLKRFPLPPPRLRWSVAGVA